MVGPRAQARLCHAHGDEPGSERVGVPVPVGLEGRAVAVELPAIELDDQPMGLEQRVDLVTGDVRREPRCRQAVVTAEGAELVLER